MPFKSEAQRKFMYAKHPKIAKKWEKHTPKGAKLPVRKHVRTKPTTVHNEMKNGRFMKDQMHKG